MILADRRLVMMTRAPLLGLAAWLFGATLSIGPIQESALRLVVTDPAGGYIHDAFVVIHWERANLEVVPNIGIDKDITGRTNSRGELAVAIPEGFYDVFVAWHVFSPFSRKVRVQRGQTTVLPVTLDMNPEISLLRAHPADKGYFD
jgi:hypothetical protein